MLHETHWYVKCLENGQTIFDLSKTVSASDLPQWQPILNWVSPLIGLPPAHQLTAPSPPTISEKTIDSRINASRAESLRPSQESLVHGDLLSVIAAARTVSEPQSRADELVLGRSLSPHERYAGPQLLLRH